MRIKHDPIHTDIILTPLESRVINSGLFNRLQYIMQTSTSYFSFPSLKHSRYSHSVGTMHVAGVMFCNIVKNTDVETINTLLQKVETIINNHILDSRIIQELKTGSDNFKKELTGFCVENTKPINCEYFYKSNNSYILNETLSIFKYSDDRKLFLYQILLESIRIVGLLHDVGHMPFSHLFENVLKEIYGDLIDLDRNSDLTEKQNYYYELLKSLIENNKNNKKIPIHEFLGEKLGLLIFDEILDDCIEIEEKIIIYIIRELVSMIFQEKVIEEFKFKKLHQIVDGAIDADRIDYVQRDVLHSGLKILAFDQNRIINNIKFDNNFNLLFPNFVLSTIENFFVSRYESYNEIIFHHKVIRTNMLLEDILIYLIKDYLVQQNDSTDKAGSRITYLLEDNITGLFNVLEYVLNNNILDMVKMALINQFEENWLLRLLKHFRYELEEKNTRRNDIENYLLDCLKDVLDDEENFITIWDNKELFKDDFFSLMRNYFDVKNDDFIDDFFYTYVSVNNLKEDDESIKGIVHKINSKLSGNKRLLYTIRDFKLGTPNVKDNIKIEYSDSIRDFEEVSTVDERLKNRFLENMKILFFTNEDHEKVEELKKQLLIELGLHFVSFYNSTSLVYYLLDESIEFVNARIDSENIKNTLMQAMRKVETLKRFLVRKEIDVTSERGEDIIMTQVEKVKDIINGLSIVEQIEIFNFMSEEGYSVILVKEEDYV
ncbi:HD domain-containing protein [Nitratifractor salsuginis]|uniref:Uncharacterized protein n=1 Tax=Nitratifractor salsuginis (strain DSM 16511 / JCM 12458 / E9I37-1) TaxID=749222 RepID=E6WYJ4_NITSE|nr:HD domain-containing protein [Nitratifractor salsuginis]ADV46506.1 hypothetical protein Nitsa_1253 [Nitratifractor salsuginis DSM 16511]